MAEGDLISGAWQVELQGVLFDALACDGIIIVDFLDGFGVPAGRSYDVQRPLRHGLYAGPQYLDGRTLTMGVAVTGDSFAEMLSRQRQVAAAFAPVRDTDADRVVPLVFTLADGNQKYRVVGKPIRAEWNYRKALRVQRSSSVVWNDGALCEFLATDPRVYANTLETATATLGSSSGGHAFPLGFPHGFGTATSGAAVCTNDGNIVTHPTITVTAGASGASGISLQNETTGDEWSITLTLNAGETLVVDMDAHTALLNGTTSRTEFVNRPPSVWWGLEPGVNSVRLLATGDGTTALVAWRDAYVM